MYVTNAQILHTYDEIFSKPSCSKEEKKCQDPLYWKKIININNAFFRYKRFLFKIVQKFNLVLKL